MLGDRCKVEHIARLETPTAIEDLFSDDFRWRFKRDGVTLNVVRSCWICNDAVAADEINFAQMVISKLQHIGACLIAVRSVIEFDAFRFRIEKWEVLWIVLEQVEVVTLKKKDRHTQYGSASESPLRREP